MRVLIKLIISLSLTVISASNTASKASHQSVYHSSLIYARIDSTKINVYHILNNKCNVCHRKRNKRRVFTSENMNPWADDIYKQVFIKKRMPKGKKIKLTNQEYQQILSWITSLKIE